MPRELPSGAVTLLFTDIEGSTRLVQLLGEARYAECLEEHRILLRRAFARHGGYEVECQGDAFFVVFSAAADAVQAAAEATRALAEHGWPAEGSIRVRVGMHTGVPLVAQADYVGEDVHLAARIAAAGHGGQVLLSNATRNSAETIDVTDLGAHRLKDFDELVSIFQLGAERFPPLKTISNTNLPRPASSFVGREREVAEIAALLRGAARLVTLSGPGGTGKSRLALEAASELVPDFRAGVFWIGLASLADASLVTEMIARTLGARDELAEWIGDREMLLLVDNMEHVIAAAPELADLVERCPNLRLLVTSRELLRVRGEVEYPVAPLAEADAVALFAARAGVNTDSAIALLCERLEHLPLALELAAARTAVLSPDQILERIAERLDFLKGGRDADPRQQTLRATVAWSHNLLSDEEQVLFARLAVFRGGATLGAIESVADADLDLLQSLVDKSLLRKAGERFWMLETIRAFAAEQLAESGEASQTEERLAHWTVQLVESAEPMLHTREQTAWIEQLSAESANLRSALAWTLEHQPRTALRLAAAAATFWQMASQFSEGRRWLESALTANTAATPDLFARALDGAGRLAYYEGDLAAARRLLEDALAVWRSLDDRAGFARSATYLAIALGHASEPDAADAIGREAIAAASDADAWTRAMALWAIGTNHVLDRVPDADTTLARPLLNEAVAIFRELGDAWGLGAPLYYLAVIAIRDNDLEAADAWLAEACACFRATGDSWRLSHALTNAAEVHLKLGRMNEARTDYEEVLPLLEALRDEQRAEKIRGRIANLPVSPQTV